MNRPLHYGVFFIYFQQKLLCEVTIFLWYFLGWVLSKILEPFNTDDPERAKDAFIIFNTLVKAVRIFFPSEMDEQETFIDKICYLVYVGELCLITL